MPPENGVTLVSRQAPHYVFAQPYSEPVPGPPDVLEIANSLVGDDNRELTPRERMLLWVAAARFGVDELDAYEFVMREPVRVNAGNRSFEVDGMLVEPTEAGHDIVIMLYRAPVGRARVVDDVSALLSLGSGPAILLALANQAPALGSILARAKVEPQADRLHLSIVTVAPVSTLPRSAVVQSPDVATEVLDQHALANLRNAVTQPEPVPMERPIPVAPGEVIETTAGEHRVVIAVVSGLAALDWPEIESRRLFDMNVRLGLGMNRVRRSLDEAFGTLQGQEKILAYHNGLTVLTNRLTVRESEIELDGISVVNGAQTLLALYENKDTVSAELRLLVKFVEIRNALDDAQEIAVRSNSQNPVSTRNLRALEPTQRRLRRELAALGLDYETRPDRGRATSQETLQNDVVAQWLCAIYMEEPWLAVKRTSLFLQENYFRIFPADLQARRVILAARIRQAVQEKRVEFPEDYHRAWGLTALTACYLVGQTMRASPGLRRMLFEPDVRPQAEADLRATLEGVVENVIRVLRAHDESQRENMGFNNYYVDFKSKQVLLRLASDAKSMWLAGGQDQ